ncbi:MAG: FHA domain-containing protein [Bdellovibrionota bacterium]
MKLVFKFDDGKFVAHEVYERTFTLGRSETCRICIPSEHFSREHCLIEFVDGKVYVTDLESKNGVFINHIRIPKKMRVSYDLKLPLYAGECFITIDIKEDLKDHDRLSLETFSRIDPGQIYQSVAPRKMAPPRAKITPVPVQKRFYDRKGLGIIILVIIAIVSIHRYRQEQIATKAKIEKSK